MKGIIIGLFVLLSMGVMAQPTTAQKKVIQNKVCYIHIVKEGNTLYSLQRLYDVPVQEIVDFNKGVDQSLRLGQIIYIPTNLPLESTATVDYFFHEVEPNQTLYGISKRYNCTVEQLLLLNPEASKGIQIGEKLKVPREEKMVTNVSKPELVVQEKGVENNKGVEATFQDSIALHTVQKGQTLYAIAQKYKIDVDELVRLNAIRKGKIKEGEILKIPLKKKVVQSIQFKPVERPMLLDSLRRNDSIIFPLKSSYKIAVILPFLFDKNGGPISGVANSKSRINPISNVAVEFYTGAKLALDSLEKLGLVAEVEFFDSKRDSATVANLIHSKAFQNTDIIIGPFFKNTIEVVANWSKENKKRMVVPVPIDTKFLKNNPYVSCAVPSELTQIKALAYFMATEHGDDNVVLVKSGLKSEALLYQVFRDEFNRLTTEKSYRSVLKEVNLGGDSGTDLSYSVAKDTLTLFVDLSENVSHVMKFMTTLNKVKNKSGFSKAQIIAVGRKEWMNIGELNSYYKNRAQLHYVSPNDLNYEKIEMKKFVLQIRDEFGVDASKYTAQGFDVMYSYLSKYCLDIDMQEGLINDIRIVQKGKGNGSENGTCFILKQQDFLIKRVGVIYD
ncbi:MAG: LysM peptidoglycan-binding domain-containing protein [Lishizhenia sp.]